MYGSKHRTTDGLYETRKDGSGYSSTKREWNSQTHEFTDETSNHRKYIRTQSSTNNRTVPSSLSSQQQRQSSDKDKKTVKDSKKPLRVFGDWSEFKSSTGKTYFYNSKTEISQWEKPKGWPTDDTSSSNARSSSTSISTDRTKKESSNSSVTSTVRSRYKMEESSYHSRHQQRDVQLVKHHQNGDIHSHLSNHNKQESSHSDETTTNLRLPSPSDDSSRMSFSSTNSKESSVATTSDRNSNVLQTSLSVPAVSVLISTSDKPLEKDFISSNGSDMKTPTSRSVIPPITKLDQSSENEPLTPSISKAERDQEIQKYYRNNFIQHLTNWPSTQLEKQCLRLFDEYYSCSAKMSTAFVELKALKSNFRVLEIKRSIVTQRLLRCQQHNKERADDKLL